MGGWGDAGSTCAQAPRSTKTAAYARAPEPSTEDVRVPGRRSEVPAVQGTEGKEGQEPAAAATGGGGDGVVLLGSGGARGGAGERRVQVPGSRAPAGARAAPWASRRRSGSGRRRRLVAVGLREAGYGGGGSGSCE